jgi:general secretion pathway protein E
MPEGLLVGFPCEDILVRQGVITAEQLDQAREMAAERGEKLEDILLSTKMVTPDQLLVARSEELAIPMCTSINTKNIPIELLQLVSLQFAKGKRILPLMLEDQCVTVACSDPYDLEASDQLRMRLNAEPILLLCQDQMLLDAINSAYERVFSSFGIGDDIEDDLEDVGKKDDVDNIDDAVDDLLEVADDEAPVIRLVNALIYRASKERASDIHIEPFEKEVVVRFRVDGVLYQVTSVPKRAQSHIAARVKIMSKLDIAEKRLPQDGRIRLKIAGKDLDLRVSTIPTAHGERIVMRLLDKSNVLLDLTKIGFSEAILDGFLDLIHRSYGIIPVTGPTGSGKTTTLYAALSRINSPDKNILTCEDPIEYQLKGIGQMQVNSKIDLTFASGLRAFLRQDPDVILVGETRDAETAEIAIQASLTGHLVFTTLHTNDAATAFTRLIDMGVEPFLVASSVIGILAQRLLRKLCTQCKQIYTPTADELGQIGLSTQHLTSYTETYRAHPEGCEHCSHSGYKGRIGIYELMMVNDQLRSMVIRNEPAGKIKQLAVQLGMTSLRDDGGQKVLKGMTSIAEVSRVTQDDMN